MRLINKLLLLLIAISISTVAAAADSSAPELKQHVEAKYNPMVYRAKVNNECYTVEVKDILIEAQSFPQGTNSNSTRDTKYCEQGFAAVGTGGGLKVREVSTGAKGYDVLRAIEAKSRLTCCKIIYVWEQA